MDGARFDTFTRAIRSRRTALGGLLGLVAGLAGLAEVEAAPCPKGKKQCKKRCIPRRRCCTTSQCRPGVTGRICRRGRCICRPGTKPCQGRCIPAAACCGTACPPPRQPNAACQPQFNTFLEVSVSFRVAQTFIEPNGGRLTAVELVINNDAAANGTYQLDVNTVDAAGVPQHTTMSSAQVPASQVGGQPVPVLFTFPTPATLLPGQKYALVLYRFNTIDDFFVALGRPDPCPGGELYRTFTTDPYSLLLISGVTSDALYRTFVSP